MSHQILETILNQLHSSSPDIMASAVVSIDGIAISWMLRQGTNPDRVGGMTAALLSLSKRAAKELACGTLKQVVVEGDDGFTVLVQAGEETALIMTAREDAKLGMILLHARQAVKQIRETRKY